MWWNQIIIDVISHTDQAYDTLGDYERTSDKKGIKFRISNTGDSDYNFLIAIHELIECFLAERHDINLDKINTFDLWFDTAERKEPEPGEHPDAPYRKEHNFAKSIEMLIAHELGINWYEYENQLDEIYLKLKAVRDAKKGDSKS